MYVMSLICDCGALEEGIVSYLTIWTRNDTDDNSYFYFDVANLGWVSGGRMKEDILWFLAMGNVYSGKILFLISIWRRQKGWNTIIFEYEEVFRLW